jgi:hypothetical protein
MNNWSTGLGDAISQEQLEAAFAGDWQPMTGRSDGWVFVAGVDLGLTRDCAAVVVLAVPSGGKAGKIRLAHNKLWRPLPGRKINLLDVERHVLELDEAFGLECVAFDPWQAEHMAQTLEVDAGHRRRNQRRIYGSMPWMREVPPTPVNLRQQATLVIELFNDRRLQLYECPPLRRDLSKLRVEEKSYGVRLVSPRDGEGHGDTFSAFALALLLGHEIAGKKPFIVNMEGTNAGDYGWQQRLAEYEREQAMFAAPNDDNETIRQYMQLAGRQPYNPDDWSNAY